MPIFTKLTDGLIPVNIWTQREGIETDAIKQLSAVSNLPWAFHHVAVMPDVHVGKGATVGSVIAMKDALSPATVGVDIGCVDADTEYLSPTGWKRIADYDGGKVMQYEPSTEHGTYVWPQFIKRESKGFLHFHTKYGIDQMLSPDHRVLIWKITGRDRRRVQVVMSAKEVAKQHTRLVQGFKAEFKTTFIPKTETLFPISDAELRVQVALMADGNLEAKSKKDAVRLNFKKDRKKIRLRALLNDAGIPYTEKDSKSIEGVTSFRFKAPFPSKTYGDFWRCSLHQLKIISDECLNWDGNVEDGTFFTRDKASADFIQYAFSATGRRGVMRSDYKDGVPDYRVFANTNKMVGLGGSPKFDVVETPSRDGLEYCFTVPSGFWIMRRGGNVAMTGNCGMTAVKATLKASELPDNLEALRSAIESAIPVGFSAHKVPTWGANKGLWSFGDVLFDHGFPYLDHNVQGLRQKAQNQVGTLGGGNHFIEICLDTEENVWLMLHSGSRNIGKELAEIHITKAKELLHNQDLPDPDLAVFLAGTPEMAAYRRDLMWAQGYAKFNRMVMMFLLKKTVREHFPATWRQKNGFDDTVGFENQISCHHNYVSEETHFGENVFVTRKGAISANVGELGIIPGSMGTKSYIVRGLGNPDSFNSASHGAGRRMSRGKAKKTFTMEDFAAQTAGVCCRKDAGVLDEIPGAYKSIDQVMANQSDLVEVVATLKQVLCVKG